MSKNSDIQARCVAEKIAGPVDYNTFVKEVTAKGYTAERTRNASNHAVAHIYREVSTRVRVDHDRPLISIYWYIQPLRGRGPASNDLESMLEMEIRGEYKAQGYIFKVFSLTPEALLLRLEEMETRLIRLWNAIPEKKG
jgi:hypothetical protein